MVTLYDWIQHDYERLRRDGKSDFADQFEAFRVQFFASDYRGALQVADDLAIAARLLNEHRWLGVVKYYQAAAEFYWRGNLAAGLDAITEALMLFQRSRQTPSHYILELAMDLWLATDAPGYALHILDALKEMSARTLAEDLTTRFSLIKARAMASLGETRSASDLVLSILPQLDWPEAYIHALRADVLLWQNRYSEALEQLHEADRSFRDGGMAIEAAGIRLSTVEAYTAQEKFDVALGTIESVLQDVKNSVNRSHTGFAYGHLGNIFRRMGEAERAIEANKKGLTQLAGLGWLRHEALIAMELLYATSDTDGDVDRALQSAEQYVYRLPSTDLQTELDTFTQQKGIHL